MDASFKFLNRALLLVAFPVLLLAAPKASASIGLGQHQIRRVEQPLPKLASSLIDLARPLKADDHSAGYFRFRLINGSAVNVVIVDLRSRHWQLRTVVNQGTACVASTAAEYRASMAINAGFFDVRRGKSVSYVTDQGKLVADPHQAKANFSAQILNRSELRLVENGQGDVQLCIASHRNPVASGGRILEAVQAGPELLPQYRAESEGFIRPTGRNRQIDVISTTSPEARTAVGITATGKLLVVCIDTPGKAPDGHGVTLPQLAKILQQLGAVQALNLDGGTSTTMYLRFSGNSCISGDSDSTGNLGALPGRVVCGLSSKRHVKSVLLLQYRQ